MVNMLAIVAVLGMGAVDDAPSSPDAATSSIRVSVRDGKDRHTVAVDSSTGAVARVDDAANPERIPLPGTEFVAELNRRTWNPARELSMLRVDAEGRETQRTVVAPLLDDPRHVAWQVGWQRLIYVAGTGADATLRSRDPRTGQESVYPVRGTIQDVRLNDRGFIAVLTITKREGKERTADIVVFLGRGSQRLVSDESIHSFAWSADGESVVYSVPGELRRATLGGATETTRLGDLDPALWNHLAHRIDVAPDGTIAMVLQFAGGRATIGDAVPAPLPGDHEIFLFQWPDRLRSIPIEGTPTDLRWEVIRPSGTAHGAVGKR